jgi:hypothetical protein
MKKGISLIVLVITIIVIVILAGAVIINLANNGPVMQASQATFKANLAEYNNELSLYISNQYLLNDGKFNSDSLNALTPAEVKDIIKGITAEDAQKIRVIDGKLAYIGADQNEIVWAEQMDVSLDVPYVKNGLVLWYDGIYNGGLGIHNDNLSTDKGVWKDLSGNGRNGILGNVNYDTSSEWLNNGLNLDGLNDYVRTPSLGTQTSITYELCIFSPNITGQVTWTNGKNTLILYNNNTAYISNSGGSKNVSTNFNINNLTTTFTVVYNISTQNAYYYQDGVLKSTVTLPTSSTTFDFTTGQYIFCNYGGGQNKAGNVYGVRFYNRVLTQTEITQNYNLDKLRYILR